MSVESQYFPDVNFSELTEVFPKRGRVERFLSRYLQREPRIYYDEHVALDQLLEDFSGTLDTVSASTGARLTMEGIHIQLITRKQLVKSLSQPSKLEEVHGDGVLENIDGNCTRNPDGKWLLNIVQNKTDHVVQVSQVKEILAHEYGHTLGNEFNANPMLEEIKAYAFQVLAISAAWRIPLASYSLSGTYANYTHDVARDRLMQLRDRGFPPEVIIATLTGKPFGNFRPDSNMYPDIESRLH